MKHALLLVCLVCLVLGFEFLMLPAIPALAQSPTPEPTPTLVPALVSPPITDTTAVTLSLQANQGAEFALFAYYQSLENAAQLAQLSVQVAAMSTTLTITDPVVITDTLSSGHVWSVRREFTYGEITVALVGLALLFLFAFRFLWDVTRPQAD